MFESYIEAIGGREAVFKLKSRRMLGTYEGAPFKFPVELKVWADAPDRFHLLISEPAGTKIEMSHDGENAWRRVDSQAEWLTGTSFIEMAESADFFGEANYEKRYSEIKVLSAVNVGGGTAYAVRAVSKSGRPYTHIFSAETGLLLVTRTTIESTVQTDEGPQKAEFELDVVLSEYEEFGGVLYPTVLVQQVVGQQAKTIWRYKEVEVNVDDDHDFGAPAGMPPPPVDPASDEHETDEAPEDG